MKNDQNYGGTIHGFCIKIKHYCILPSLFVNKNIGNVVPQSPYSPDVGPCNKGGLVRDDFDD